MRLPATRPLLALLRRNIKHPSATLVNRMAKNAENQVSIGPMSDYSLLAADISPTGAEVLTDNPPIGGFSKQLTYSSSLARRKSEVYPPPCVEPRAVLPEGENLMSGMVHQAACQIDQVLHHTADPTP